MAAAATLADRVQTRLAALQAERDQFVAEANLRLGQYNAAIGELRALLAPVAPDTDGAPEPDADRRGRAET